MQRLGSPRTGPELRFRFVDNPGMFSPDRRLVCPQCGENLTRPDIEVFLTCPFCSHRFEPSPELEDYILEPEVDSWMKRQPGFTFHFLNRLSEQGDL